VERKSTLRKLLSSSAFLVLNINLAKALGINEALLIHFLIYKEEYWEQQNKLNDGGFYCTHEDIKDKTTLSSFQQRKALSNLTKLGILEIKFKGLPAKNYFYLNHDKINKLFTEELQINDERSEHQL
jgi:hypothetical protein